MTFNASYHDAQRFSSNEPYDQRHPPNIDRRSRFNHGRMAESEPVDYNDSRHASRSNRAGTFGDMPPPNTRASSQKMTRFSDSSPPPSRQKQHERIPSPPPRHQSWSKSPTSDHDSWNDAPHVRQMAPAPQYNNKHTSPARALDQSDQAWNGERSDHGNASSKDASRSFNEAPSSSPVKRKAPLNEVSDTQGQCSRNVRARSACTPETLAVQNAESETDDLILKLIEGIESLAGAKFRLCSITSKKEELSKVAKDGFESMSKASQRRFSEICNEVDTCSKKVDEWKVQLSSDLKKLMNEEYLRPDKRSLASVEKILQEVEKEAFIQPQKECNDRTTVEGLHEQSDQVMEDSNKVEDSHVEALVQATLQRLLPKLIDEAIDQHRSSENADHASTSKGREGIPSPDAQLLAQQTSVEHENELVQLRDLVAELQQNSLKRDQDLENLQSRINDLQENMSIQERFVTFHTAAILRHEGSLLDLK